MEESPRAASASAGAATPEEKTALEEKPRRERSRLRVPTSLLVTVLVALLTVWVAPAFTRQWEDRQKARDLQAETSELISAASADALGKTLALAESPADDAAVERVRSEWLVARYRIQARLDTYFSSRVSKQWNAHGELVTRTIDVVRVAGHPSRGSDWCVHLHGPRHGRCVRKFAVNHVARGLRAAWELFIRGYDLPEGSLEGSLAYGGTDDFSPDGVRRWTVRNASEIVLQSVGWVTKGVHSESPRGFSTTRGDLLRDLAP
jgi:hypothetical protein